MNFCQLFSREITIVWQVRLNVTNNFDSSNDDVLMLQDKLLAKMDKEEEEKMPYSADDQVTYVMFILFIGLKAIYYYIYNISIQSRCSKT